MTRVRRQSLFYIDGLLPLGLSMVLIRAMPDSIEFLVMRKAASQPSTGPRGLPKPIALLRPRAWSFDRTHPTNATRFVTHAPGDKGIAECIQ
jgi:hypothetical protein